MCKKTFNFKKALYSFLAFSVIGSGLFALSHKVIGQQAGFNIEVSPGKVNLSVEHGKSYTQKFRIGNYSGADKNLYIYVQDFTVMNEEGTPTFFENINTQMPEAAKFSLSKWVKLPTDKIFLKNNETAEVEAVISIPDNAEAGGHYGAFFVQTERPEQTGTSIGSVGRLASLMLINVPGDVKEEIKLLRAFTGKSIYWDDNPQIEFVTYLKNEGSVHGIPVGAFNVTGGYASKTKSVIYNQDQGAVLPGAPERKISQAFQLDKKNSIVPPIGKFTISLISRYGTSNLPLETTVFFWLLPAKFIAAASLVILVSVFVIWRALVSFKK